MLCTFKTQLQSNAHPVLLETSTATTMELVSPVCMLSSKPLLAVSADAIFTTTQLQLPLSPCLRIRALIFFVLMSRRTAKTHHTSPLEDKVSMETIVFTLNEYISLGALAGPVTGYGPCPMRSNSIFDGPLAADSSSVCTNSLSQERSWRWSTQTHTCWWAPNEPLCGLRYRVTLWFY